MGIVTIGNDFLTLSLGPIDDGDIEVAIKSQMLNFKLDAYCDYTYQNLYDYFNFLNENWKGFKGSKTFETMHYKLESKSTLTGHINLSVRVNAPGQMGFNEILLDFELVLEPLQLQKIVSDLKHYF